MRRHTRSLINFTVLLFVATVSASETIRLDFDDPLAIGVDRAGSLFVLEGKAGVVTVVEKTPAPHVVNKLGEKPGPGRLKDPTDVAVDRSGNIVVADAGNYRVVVYDRAGAVLRSVPFEGSPLLERIVPMPDGTVRVLSWDGTSESLVVTTLDSKYRQGASFAVDTYCEARGSDARMADLAVDGDGNLWLVDLYGCRDEYTVRKLSGDGKLLGTWSRVANQISREAQEKWKYMARIVSGVFAADDRVFLVLGAGGAETGGLDVDVWSTSGSWLRRTKLVGPARPLVRAVVHEGRVYLADPDGLKAVVGIDLATL